MSGLLNKKAILGAKIVIMLILMVLFFLVFYNFMTNLASSGPAELAVSQIADTINEVCESSEREFETSISPFLPVSNDVGGTDAEVLGIGYKKGARFYSVHISQGKVELKEDTDPGCGCTDKCEIVKTVKLNCNRDIKIEPTINQAVPGEENPILLIKIRPAGVGDESGKYNSVVEVEQEHAPC